jgi:hypothetical protein
LDGAGMVLRGPLFPSELRGVTMGFSICNCCLPDDSLMEPRSGGENLVQPGRSFRSVLDLSVEGRSITEFGLIGSIDLGPAWTAVPGRSFLPMLDLSVEVRSIWLIGSIDLGPA